MKKKLLLTIFILIIALPSMAIVTVEENNSEESLNYQGYSSEMARLVNIRCAQAAGKMPAINNSEPDYYKKFNWIRKTFIYLDPALDDGSFMRHEYHVNPSIHDL